MNEDPNIVEKASLVNTKPRYIVYRREDKIKRTIGITVYTETVQGDIVTKRKFNTDGYWKQWTLPLGKKHSLPMFGALDELDAETSFRSAIINGDGIAEACRRIGLSVYAVTNPAFDAYLKDAESELRRLVAIVYPEDASPDASKFRFNWLVIKKRNEAIRSNVVRYGFANLG